MEPHGTLCTSLASPSWFPNRSPPIQREDVYKHFRWSPRITAQVIGGMIVFPLTIYFIAAKTDVRSPSSGFYRAQAHPDTTAQMEMDRKEKGREFECMSPAVLRVYKPKRYYILLHNSIATLHPPPIIVLSKACAGARCE